MRSLFTSFASAVLALAAGTLSAAAEPGSGAANTPADTPQDCRTLKELTEADIRRRPAQFRTVTCTRGTGDQMTHVGVEGVGEEHVEVAVARIRNEEAVYYTACKGALARLVVVTAENGAVHLRSCADASACNNLSNLPACAGD